MLIKLAVPTLIFTLQTLIIPQSLTLITCPESNSRSERCDRAYDRRETEKRVQERRRNYVELVQIFLMLGSTVN